MAAAKKPAQRGSEEKHGWKMRGKLSETLSSHFPKHFPLAAFSDESVALKNTCSSRERGDSCCPMRSARKADDTSNSKCAMIELKTERDCGGVC